MSGHVGILSFQCRKGEKIMKKSDPRSLVCSHVSIGSAPARSKIRTHSFFSRIGAGSVSDAPQSPEGTPQSLPTSAGFWGGNRQKRTRQFKQKALGGGPQGRGSLQNKKST